MDQEEIGNENSFINEELDDEKEIDNDNDSVEINVDSFSKLVFTVSYSG